MVYSLDDAPVAEHMDCMVVAMVDSCALCDDDRSSDFAAARIFYIVFPSH
jgi:hypothetical protein